MGITMKLTDKLKQRRAGLVAEQRAIIETPAGDGGDLSTEQAARFDTLKREIEGVDANIQRAEFLDEAERRQSGTPITGSGDGAFDDECRRFSLCRAIAGAAGLDVDWGREREVGQELARRSGKPSQGILVPRQIFMERRVVTTTAPAQGPGSNLVSTDHRGDLYIDILRAKLVTQALGATVLNDLVGNLRIPRLDQSAVAYWVAENAAITSSDPQYGSVSMSPKHVGAIVEVSRNMVLQTSPDIEQLLRRDFAGVLAEAVDRAAIRGGGANEPDGVLNTVGINTVSMLSGPSWEGVLELIEAVETSNSEGTGFVASPKVVKAMRSTPKQAGGVEGAFIMTDPNSLAGYPLMKSTLPTEQGSPATEPLIFGRWSDLLIGMWGSLELLLNPFEGTAFSKGNILLRGLMSVDVNVRHPESFAAAHDLGTVL
jgi:HK97 family phage major capsid protein